MPAPPGFALVLFDLDGTLLDPARDIRPANRRAIAALMARGVRVGLATGRAPKSAAPYVERISATGPLILYNGAMVWDVPSGRAVHTTHLPREDALRAIALARDTSGVHVNVYVEGEVWIAAMTETARRSADKDGVEPRVVGDVIARVRAQNADIIKLMLIDEQAPVMRLAGPLGAALASPCTLVNSEPDYLEVLPPGVHKGQALGPIEQHYGIARERVLAFGDRYNDIELLGAAGLGVAMGNAPAEVQEAADVVIGRHDSDAIAEFLRARFAL